MVALESMFPSTSFAEGDLQRQAGEDRWVPSLAIISGVTVQEQKGSADSLLFEAGSPSPSPLQGPADGDDLAVSPFVGGTLEVMAPALPIPTRPRFFVSGEILPTFSSDRSLALDGDPDCVRGPEPDAPCARDEDGSRLRAFGEDSLNGTGIKTSAEISTLVYGASAGVAFPLQLAGRQLRIKPSFGWISYKVEAKGLLVDGQCDPVDRCTDVASFIPGFPPNPGFLREITLTGSESRRFHAIGPGLDVEMDVARFHQLGASLFLGGRAYHVEGDRKISFGSTQGYNDQLGADASFARFKVRVDPWLYRAHVGIRFLWLGPE